MPDFQFETTPDGLPLIVFVRIFHKIADVGQQLMFLKFMAII
jgi:hypothetical protein